MANTDDNERVYAFPAGIVLPILAVTAVLLLTAVTLEGSDGSSAALYEGKCGEDVYYSLDYDGTLQITGSGDMYDYSSYWSQPWYRFRDNIRSVDVGYGVTSVGAYSFQYCDNLRSITTSESVVYVGTYAFERCTSLKEVSMPYVLTVDNRAFERCTALTDVGMGSVKTLRDLVFNKCSSLESVYLPSVKTMRTSVFRECTSLESVVLSEDIKTLGKSSFHSCGSLRTVTALGLTSIGEYVFNDCTSLEEVCFPLLESIGSWAFYGCTSLANVSFPALESMAENAFNNCRSLTEVSFPLLRSVPEKAFYGCTSLAGISFAALESVSDSAFEGCASLKSMSLPSTTSIGDHAFKRCTALEDLALPPDLTYLGKYAFEGCTSLRSVTFPLSLAYIPYQSFSGCISLTDIVIPDTVTEIGSYAFSGCRGLSSVTISDKVETVGSGAFSDCRNLVYVKLPESYVDIGSNVFSGCTSLVSIPSSEKIVSIGDCAFSGCSSIVSIDLPSVRSIGDRTFKGCTSLVSVDLPAGLEGYPAGMFEGCTSLVSIDLSDTSLALGEGSFAGCTSLKDVTLPRTTPSVVKRMFEGCTSLESIDVPGLVNVCNADAFKGCTALERINWASPPTRIEDRAFEGCTSLSDPGDLGSLKSVGQYAFSGCVSLTGIHMPSVTSIGTCAFSGCTSLIYAEDLGSLKTLGSSAFSGCTALVGIDLPSVVTVGSCAFLGCVSIMSVDLPSTLKNLGDFAFENCFSLVHVGISSSPSLSNHVFEGCRSLMEVCNDGNLKITAGSSDHGKIALYADRVYSSDSETSSMVTVVSEDGTDRFVFRCTDGSYSLVKSNSTDGYVVLPGSFTVDGAEIGSYTVGGYAFYRAESVVDVELSSAVTALEPWAFTESRITSMDLGHLTSVGKHTFRACPDLVYVSMPNVRTVGSNAFRDCPSLREVSMPSAVSIGGGSFSGCTALGSICFPSSVKNVYEGAFQGMEFRESEGSALLPHTASALAGKTFLGFGDGKLYIDPPGATVTFIVDGEVFATVLGQKGPFSEKDVSDRVEGFHGWFSDGGLTVRYDVSSYVGSDLVLFTSSVHIEGEACMEDVVEATEEHGGSYELTVRCRLCGEVLYSEHMVTPRIDWIAEGTSDGISWKVSNTGTLTVEGTGNIPDDPSWKPYADIVVSIEVEEGVTGIGARAFAGFPSLTAVSLPVTLSSLGEDAFEGTVFTDLDGNVLGHTAMALRGHTFAGSGSALVRQDDRIHAVFMVDGSEYAVQVYSPGDRVVLPGTPVTDTPEGYSEYHFVKWKGYTKGMSISGDRVFEAVFKGTLNVYDAVFVFGNGKAVLQVEHGSAIPLPDFVPVKTSADGGTYAFTGWEGYSEGMVAVGDMEFVAVFSYEPPFDHTVTVVYSDGTSDVCKVRDGGSVDFGRAVYGYYRDPGMTKAWSPLTKVHRDMTVYALSEVSGLSGGDTVWGLDFSTGVLRISGTGPTDDWSSTKTPWYVYRDRITDLVVEEGVTYLGSFACYKYPCLTEVVLPDSLTGLGDYAVVTYVAEHVRVGSGILELGIRSLHGMVFMEGDTELPVKFWSLYSKEFYGEEGVLRLRYINGTACDTVWTVDVASKTLTVSGEGSAGDWKATTAPWYLFRGYFEHVVVEDGVTDVGDYSFYSYSGLTSIVLGKDVHRIGTNSLRKCTSLREIVFGEGLEEIGDKALYGYSFCSAPYKYLPRTASALAGHSFVWGPTGYTLVV